LPHWLKLRIELRLDPQGTIGRRAARRDKPAVAAMTDSHPPSTARPRRRNLPEFRRVLPLEPELAASPLEVLPPEPEPVVSRPKVPPLEVLPLEPEPVVSRPKVPPLKVLPLKPAPAASRPKVPPLEVLPLVPERLASQLEVSPLRPVALRLEALPLERRQAPRPPGQQPVPRLPFRPRRLPRNRPSVSAGDCRCWNSDRR
jgi:hypothetical protein